MTKLLVLGLLDERPMSGYDIQQMLKVMDAEHWGGVLVGSIYHALKKMEAEGLVEVISVEQTGHRQKAVYQITEKGSAYLKKLVRDALKTSSVVYPSRLYSGLSYVHKLPKEEALESLHLHADALDREYQVLGEGLKAKSKALNDNVPSMTKLIFENMFAIIRQQQNFISKAMLLLNSQE